MIRNVKKLSKLKKLSVSELLDKGYELLEEDDFDDALLVSKALKHHRNTGTFEIGARALWGLGKYDAAIRMLEDAVSRFPTMFVFRDYLASFYSDLGDYTRALDLYRSCIGLEGAVDHMVQLNQAIVYGRMDDYTHALIALNQITLPTGEDADRFVQAFHSARLCFLVNSRQYGDAVADGRQYLDVYPDNASAMAWLSKAVWLGQGDKDKALDLAYEAARLDKSMTPALDVIREVNGDRSPKAVVARIIVQGIQDLEDSDGVRRFGFYTSYEVAYEHRSQVQQIIEPFEPRALPSSLRIRKIKRIREAPNELLGVLQANPGYTLYEVQEQ